MQLNRDKVKTKPPRASEFLRGDSPLTRYAQKRDRVVDWTYRWGHSFPDIIRTVSGQAATGFAQKLVRAGLLLSTLTESGGFGLPRSYCTLSLSGLEHAQNRSEHLLRYPELDRYRVNQQQLRHSLIAQRVTAKALALRLIADYQTERMLDSAGDKAGVKRPDAVWVMPDGTRMAIEVELSAKWERKLDEFVLGVARSLLKSADRPARFERVAVITDSPAILARYEQALRPGSPVSEWKKDARHHWVRTKTFILPDSLADKIDFKLINQE